MSIQSYICYREMLNHISPELFPGISYWVCQMRDFRYGTIWARCDTTEDLYNVVDHLIQGAGELSALNDFIIKMFAEDEEVSAATLRRWADDHDIHKLSFYDRLKRDQERRNRK